MSGACIVGVGQRMAGDDGVGLAVIDHLARAPLPAAVTLATVREPSGLLPLLAGPDAEVGWRLVIVDAVVGEQPGQVLVLAPEDVEVRGVVSVSSHGLSVAQAIALGRRLAASAAPPPVRIVAVTIARATPGEGLSPEVAAAVQQAATRALMLAQRGLE